MISENARSCLIQLIENTIQTFESMLSDIPSSWICPSLNKQKILSGWWDFWNPTVIII
jgi:hypothetical protein